MRNIVNNNNLFIYDEDREEYRIQDTEYSRLTQLSPFALILNL